MENDFQLRTSIQTKSAQDRYQKGAASPGRDRESAATGADG